MKIVVNLIILSSFLSCGAKKETVKTEVTTTVETIKPSGITELIEFGPNDGYKGFIKWPAATIKGWIWYAPTLLAPGGTPNPIQHKWMFEQFSKNGLAVIGADVGEAYGSPQGRAMFTELHKYIQTRGLDKRGCMLLQSRGGLHGYIWLMDNPGIIKCVVGIYPMVTVNDYIGIPGIAPQWGMTEQWMRDNLSAYNPLDRVDSLTGVNILHLHGDADGVVHLNYDQQFIDEHIANGEEGELIIIPAKGHEYLDPAFFQSERIIEFLQENM